MTLFITTPNRQFAIDDVYVSTLSFVIFFGVGKVLKAVIEKQSEKNTSKFQIPEEAI